MNELTETAPAFVDMAHRIVWCTAATVATDGSPRTRVLHPIWEWDGDKLTGWVATSPQSPKADDLASTPQVSMTYWDRTQDTCTVDCNTVWETDQKERELGWHRFEHGEPPVGYDPQMIPGWTSYDAEAFGILRLEPHRIRLLPGSLMTSGIGKRLSWKA